MNDFFKDQLPTIITAIAGLSAWIYEKRKKNAELQVAESDAIAAMQASYKTFVADMNAKYEDIKVELAAVKAELAAQKQENLELQKRYEDLKSEMNG